MRRDARQFVAVFALAGAFGSATAETGDESAPVVEEIVVTATRRDTVARDVPFNVVAVSGDVLDRIRAGGLKDLAGVVPGLIVVDQGHRAASRMPVRGLNVASLNESPVLFNSGGGTVATYVGEVPVYIDLQLHDLERVEVLLGPQGTVYGAGTLGGAIRYIPKVPLTTVSQAALSVSAFAQAESSNSGSEVWGMLNLPFIDERLALRVSALHCEDPGYIDYPFLLREPGASNPNPDFNDPADVLANLRRENDVDAGDIVSARAALLWEPNDTVSVTASYDFQETDFGGRSVNHRHAIGTGRYEAAHRIPEPSRRRNEIASVDVRINLGFAQLTSITGVTEYREDGERDGTDLLLGFDFGSEFPNFVAIARDGTDEERFHQELRLVSGTDGSRDWIAGAYYNGYEFSHALSELGPGYAEFLGIERPDGLLSVIQLEEDVDEFALFGELSQRLTPRWRVSIGARRFHSRRTSGNATDFPLSSTLAGFSGPDDINLDLQSFDFDDNGMLFKVSSSYGLSEGVLAYATVSEGYRPGGVNPFAPCPAPIGCLRPNEIRYAPDSTLNYEFGVKGLLLSDRLGFSVAAYLIDWDDIQLDAISEDLFFITVNGGDARSRGIELSADAIISDRLRASLAYSYNRAELWSFAAGLVDGVADGVPGDRLPGTPEHQGALRIDYDLPLGDRWQLELGYGLTATSNVYTKVGRRAGGEALAGYAIHNFTAWLRTDGAWSFRFFVDNLFDEFAETNTRADRSFIRNAGVHPLRSYFRNVATPRRYGIELRYDFETG